MARGWARGMVQLPACPRHSYRWIVPITWKTSENVGADRYWLTEDSGTVHPGSGGPAATSPDAQRSGSPRGTSVGGVGAGVAVADHPLTPPATNEQFRVGTSNWLLLNLNVSGYFRVNYNQENWDQLLGQLSRDPQVHGAGQGPTTDPHTPCTQTPYSGLP